MTYKVLIVDDEWTIRKMLIKMIEANHTGWTVIGEAANGEEAIEQIKAHQPNLVLTDIRMPKMSGIALAEYIDSYHNEIKVIILTAYKDFEYAKAAIKYNVIDFLLKPCPEAEVIDLLQRVYRSKMEAAQKERKEQQYFERNMFRSLCLKHPHDGIAVQGLKEKYGGSALFMIQVIDYFPATKSYTFNDLDLLQYSVLNIIEEIMYEQLNVHLVIPMEYNGFLSVISKHDQEEHMFVQIETTIFQLLGLEIIVHYLGDLNELEDATAHYQHYWHTNILPMTQGESGVAFDDSTMNKVDQQTINDMKAMLLSPLLIGDYDQFKATLDESMNRIAKRTLSNMKREAFTLVYVLHSISQQEFQFELPFIMSKEITNVQYFGTTDAIMDWLNQYVASFWGAFDQWKQETSETIVDRVKNFVHIHYMESCTLSEAASNVYLSPKYLSDLFKKSTGESFTNYVTTVRMKRAEMLLRNTTLMIAEIAKRVGYDDPNYFSTVFRKTFQVSPAQFRKK